LGEEGREKVVVGILREEEAVEGAWRSSREQVERRKGTKDQLDLKPFLSSLLDTVNLSPNKTNIDILLSLLLLSVEPNRKPNFHFFPGSRNGIMR